MTQWSCYCVGESVCSWLEIGNSMETWRQRTHNMWRWRTTLIKSERCYWMLASLCKKYNRFSDRGRGEQQHRTMTFAELPNHPLLLHITMWHWLVTTFNDRSHVLFNSIYQSYYMKLVVILIGFSSLPLRFKLIKLR